MLQCLDFSAKMNPEEINYDKDRDIFSYLAIGVSAIFFTAMFFQTFWSEKTQDRSLAPTEEIITKIKVQKSLKASFFDN